MTTLASTPPSTVFETKRVLITPIMARKTLEQNKLKNRRINPMRVKYFVDLMKHGQFMCSPQGIALDDENNIIDGQHRLQAIADSNCSVYMMVSKGVPLDCMAIIDCGQPRTLHNRMALIGKLFSPREIALARILEYGIVASSQNSLGVEEAIRIVDKYEDAIRFASELSHDGVIAPVLAVVARAYYTQDRDKIKRFVEVYKSETPKNEFETAPLKLKRRVVGMGSLKGGSGNAVVRSRELIYQLTESALYRFLKGQSVSSLVPSAEEKFLIP